MNRSVPFCIAPICRSPPLWYPPQTTYRSRGRRCAHLPLHLVGLVAAPQAEGAGEVAAKEALLLDVGQDGLVDGLLVAGAGAGNLLLLQWSVRPWTE